MLKRVPKMCLTCQHYEPYHCTLDDTYIGYIYADKPNNQCKGYSLSEHYRKGGKFYESRKVKQDAFDKVLNKAQIECKRNGGNFRYGVLNNVRANLEKAPTVCGWISVKDRLPENAKHPGAFCPRYLVYTCYGITEGWYNPDKECWYGFLTFMTDIYEEWNIDLEKGDIPKRVKNIPVKYWMPLPESPKE